MINNQVSKFLKSPSKVIKTLNWLKQKKDEKHILIKNLWSLDRIRGHKFITMEILNKAEKIGKQEEVKNPQILVKYFSPSMTFYITEIETSNPQQAFWYVVDENSWKGELWYINLLELSQSKNWIWMPIERDMYFIKNTINDIKPKINMDFSNNLIEILNNKVNWENIYEKYCYFSNNNENNKFEIVWKHSDWQIYWDNIIISHEELPYYIKGRNDIIISNYIIWELNNRLKILV